ncbi:MAG: OmpA family protein [Mucilaginibacter sp.]
MNSSSTLKKTVALSFAALMFVGVANAQTDSTSMTTMSTEPTAAKVFGGAGQYNKFSIGINAGVTTTGTPLPGPADYNGKNKLSLGYGISFREQFSHVFGIVLDVNGGKVKGQRDVGQVNQGYVSFDTEFWQGTLSAHFNVASMSFLHRKNGVNFYAKAGAGLALYAPSGVTDFAPGTFDWKGTAGPNKDRKYVREYVVPVGVGAKFRLSDAVALNLGYTINFIDGDNFDGLVKNYPANLDKYSYGYAGLEFTLGSSSKANIDWVNPVAMMYDELYDPALRAEVEALKGRVSAVETAVSDMKKDSDGDGVSDQFDKCPNTPAGTVVDGAGCAIVFPAAAAMMAEGASYSNIQFEFDSSVLRTSAYPALDATSADLRSSGATVTVKGFASSEGTAAHNLQLSKDRANSVKTYLVNSGVDAKQLKVKALGETMPVADNSTEEGRVLNRRVEFAK